MSWKSALLKAAKPAASFSRPVTKPRPLDLNRVVTVDFETYYDTHYTLKKLSTSEYVRDERFKIQMVGVKIGTKPTQVLTEAQARKVLGRINWSTHTLLCHNTMFDGFVLKEHFGIVPSFYYDTLSMARALHSNEIGAGLDEVAKYYGGDGKLDGLLEHTQGVLDWSPEVFKMIEPYCAQDVDETFRIFQAMHDKFPADELEVIDLTMRMFCDPVLLIDTDRLTAEYQRELNEREQLFMRVIEPQRYDIGGDRHDPALLKTVLKTRAERALQGQERLMLIAKRLLGNNEFFADLLRAEGIEPPVKVSKAWIKKAPEERNDDDKYGYAFAKDDEDFVSLPERMDLWRGELSPDNPQHVPLLAAKQQRVQDLVDARLSVKSTITLTRAERMLRAGADGRRLPVGYAYYRAHTGRYGGTNKMNLQNLPRGSELRLSIMAPKGYEMCVVDSGQIEARVNAWLWGQDDLLDAFRKADTWDKSKGVARGNDRDAYCRFADDIYGREITTEDKTERFVGKVCVLGLGYQMGAAKLQMTLAKGALGGPPVYFELNKCYEIVNAYRRRNHKIRDGWTKCQSIIEDMALGRTGSYKCLNWEKETIWLPNGMRLHYPDLKAGVNRETGYIEYSYAIKEGRSKIYGGLLCENLVQALARIIVFTQMLQINRRYRVVMSTHDEVVALPPSKDAQRCFDYMMKCMTTPPAWCADIPLNAEGGWARNYSK